MKKNAQGDDLNIEDIISKLPEIELANLDRISEMVEEDLLEFEEMDEVLEQE
jgi:hypothetical protein